MTAVAATLARAPVPPLHHSRGAQRRRPDPSAAAGVRLPSPRSKPRRPTPAAIYCLTPATEEVARAAAERLGDPRPARPAAFREIEHYYAEDNGG